MFRPTHKLQHFLSCDLAAVFSRASSLKQVTIARKRLGNAEAIAIPTRPLLAAVNTAHRLIDDLYSAELDVAAILGLRNLSAFVGELYAAALAKESGGLLAANPHQDGYPDLLLMDAHGQRMWSELSERRDEKAPFSPFAGSGLEVKATCGNVPALAVRKRKGIKRPELGDTRIDCLSRYEWKAHHRGTNNLVGLLWDFIVGRPRIAAVFYASNLAGVDWGEVVGPGTDDSRTTSVSVIDPSGIRKLYEGWLCVLLAGGYREFLNHRNGGDLIA